MFRFFGILRKLPLTYVPTIDNLCSVSPLYGSQVNKNLWSFIQDDYIWQSICINQFPADYGSAELKKMVAEEDALRGNNSEEQHVNVNKKLYKRLCKLLYIFTFFFLQS